MHDKKQIMVSSLVQRIHSHLTKYHEFILPSRAQGLDTVTIQKQGICISEGKRSLKLAASLNLRLVYVEQETFAFKVYELKYHTIAYEQCVGYREGNYYNTSLAPDSRFKLSLLKPDVIAIQSKLHVVIKVFSKEHLFIDETMDGQKPVHNPVHVNIAKKGHYSIPGVGTIQVSVDD